MVQTMSGCSRCRRHSMGRSARLGSMGASGLAEVGLVLVLVLALALLLVLVFATSNCRSSRLFLSAASWAVFSLISCSTAHRASSLFGRDGALAQGQFVLAIGGGVACPVGQGWLHPPLFGWRCFGRSRQIGPSVWRRLQSPRFAPTRFAVPLRLEFEPPLARSACEFGRLRAASSHCSR